MSDWQKFLNRQLNEDPEFRKEWERSEPLWGIISDAIHRRLELGLTQAELAERMGKKQPSIARFEAGNAENPTLSFLQALADALDMQLSVHLVPKEESVAKMARRVAEERTPYSAS